jgi:hypothetical protein
MTPRNQIRYPIEAGTYYLSCARPASRMREASYRALGGSGTGSDPFRAAGGSGTGSDPFRATGGSGTGSDPLAIITAPSLCAITTVFRPIAPARTNMARSSAVSLRDIECLQGTETPEVLYIELHQCQAAHKTGLFRKSTHPLDGSLRQAFARVRSLRGCRAGAS